MKKLIFLLPILLLALENIEINVNKKILKKGETLILTITTHGNNIVFPNLKAIEKTPIIATMIKDTIVVINGNLIDKVSKLYFLRPDKNITIPSLEIIVDGKIYKTNPINIEVKN
ncbi:protein BatD [Caminibacter mediatlanticus TB-2]|uniref:Protein BatD n=1 Tax=Caminibacter mediatlanticus TB-2 TaxID=391592 RepID=A0AAI9AI79_9BACT|nr:BatD family protein [Caminibacter mediatlanticus]EDM23949.1 hypothetical protein CMTB2_06836 [Caminibacter mediatlanticus TB-2]QCT94314.1 protein BatD [Caminibacter mediatlanticus TB-2]